MTEVRLHISDYRIGQWVKMVYEGFEVRRDDIGTVVDFDVDNDRFYITDLWHGLEREEKNVASWMIQPYEDPLDIPNYSVGSGQTVRALATAINHTLPYAFEEVTRDLERARMQQEYIRTDYKKAIDDKNARIESALTSLDCTIPYIDEPLPAEHRHWFWHARRELIQSLPHHSEYEDNE